MGSLGPMSPRTRQRPRRSLIPVTVVTAAALVFAILLVLVRLQWHPLESADHTGAGAQVLDPVIKSLVGRLRPVVAHPVAHAPGNSFPSGHSLGSLVCYGALFLVFAPAARGRGRTAF